MREAICESKLADINDVVIDPNLSARERYAEYKRQLNDYPNDYWCYGYIVHDTFEQDGPPFVDCVVRIFKV
jgi:hypothetical protein